MALDLKEKIEGIRKVLKTNDKLAKRLPDTYPHVSLVLHLDEQALQAFWRSYFIASGEPPIAFADPESDTIHVSASLAILPSREIARVLLHEYGHMYAIRKFGMEDPRADDKAGKMDERFANRFANRWLARLRAEGWFA